VVSGVAEGGAGWITVTTRSVHTAGLAVPVAANAVRKRMPPTATAMTAGAMRHTPTRVGFR